MQDYLVREYSHDGVSKFLLLRDHLGSLGAPLLIDPLTRLVTYDSMEGFIKKRLTFENSRPLLLAIGDVDGLRDYVTSCNQSSANMFGHLAGNHCMKLVGHTVGEWQARQSIEQTWLSGTFGGDEVIVFSEGVPFDHFVESIRALSAEIKELCPRPCSFACSEYVRSERLESVDDAFTAWVSSTDRQLFEAKEDRETYSEGFVIRCTID
jgi:GGDEF domain-containing protein